MSSSAVSPCSVSIRMSMGPGARKLMPRAGSSSCGELTPRSATIPSTSSTPSAPSWLGEVREPRRARCVTAAPKRASRSRANAIARSSRSSPTSRAPGRGLEDRLGVPAAADRRVDVDAARARRERAPPPRPCSTVVCPNGSGSGPEREFIRRHVHILSCSATARRKLASSAARHRLRFGPLLVRPELDHLPHAGPEHVLLQARVIAQRVGDQHAPLLVDLALDRGRDVEPAELDDVRLELRKRRDLRLELLPGPHREEVEAGVEGRGREHQAQVARAASTSRNREGRLVRPFASIACSKCPRNMLSRPCLPLRGLSEALFATLSHELPPKYGGRLGGVNRIRGLAVPAHRGTLSHTLNRRAEAPPSWALATKAEPGAHAIDDPGAPRRSTTSLEPPRGSTAIEGRRSPWCSRRGP